MIYNELETRLAPFGLICRGGFQVDDKEGLKASGSLVMIGNAGSALWQAFSKAPEREKTEHPLDDWTRSIIDPIASALDATPYYPFEGPPYYPFQQWAMRAEPVYLSPTGPLIHPIYGLWHAYRAALLFKQINDFPEPVPAPSPCESCIDKPCLSACPVGAFEPNRYDIPACVGHLNSLAMPKCRSAGCLARHACPVGQAYAYQEDHARFHMDKFIDSRPGSAD